MSNNIKKNFPPEKIWENFLETTKNLNDYNSISSSITEKNANFILEKINIFFSNQSGEPLMIANQLDKVLYSIPFSIITDNRYSPLVEPLLLTYTNLVSNRVQSTTLVNDYLYNQEFSSNITSIFTVFLETIKNLKTSRTNNPFSFIGECLYNEKFKIGNITNKKSHDTMTDFSSILPEVCMPIENMFNDIITNINYNNFYINDTDKKFIENSIKLYKNNEFACSTALLSTRIESILRTILLLKGGCDLCITKYQNNFFITDKTFEKLINDNKINTLFTDEMLILLKGTFSDNYGLNIRNKVCHGSLIETSKTKYECILVITITMYIASSNFEN